MVASIVIRVNASKAAVALMTVEHFGLRKVSPVDVGSLIPPHCRFPEVVKQTFDRNGRSSIDTWPDCPVKDASARLFAPAADNPNTSARKSTRRRIPFPTRCTIVGSSRTVIRWNMTNYRCFWTKEKEVREWEGELAC
jgi:hypothetical protein